MVITIGLEPTTSSMSRKYSTTELRDLFIRDEIISFFDLNRGYLFARSKHFYKKREISFFFVL